MPKLVFVGDHILDASGVGAVPLPWLWPGEDHVEKDDDLYEEKLAYRVDGKPIYMKPADVKAAEAEVKATEVASTATAPTAPTDAKGGN